MRSYKQEGILLERISEGHSNTINAVSSTWTSKIKVIQRYSVFPQYYHGHSITKPRSEVGQAFSEAPYPISSWLQKKAAYGHLYSQPRISTIPVAMKIPPLTSSPWWPERAPSRTHSPSISQLLPSTGGREETSYQVKMTLSGSRPHFFRTYWMCYME